MANYQRIKAVDELPPARPHYKKLRLDARSMVVLRNSRKGKWSRYAHYPTQETAYSKASKLRASQSFKRIGKLDTAVRFDPQTKRWILWLKFVDLKVTDVDIKENIEDLGGPGLLDAEEIAPVPEG